MVEVIIWLFVFTIFIVISSVLNILLKMTERKHWIISLVLSMFLSIFTIAMLGVGPQ